ncbi:MAG: hypothetical protein JW955_05030 [Sedimentisphaerales bacterium]|nr:hypothetical protein [Sedimentisphaerales bacterium]
MFDRCLFLKASVCALVLVLATAASHAPAASVPNSPPAASQPATMPDVPVCAIIADQAVQEEYLALIGLLEAKLSGNGKLRLVERNEIDKVLKEQELGAAFAAEGVGRRIKLGALLKADLLVFLRERQGKEKDAKAIEVAVAETRRGLRLVMETTTWEPARAEQIVDNSVGAVHRASNLAPRADLRIFAVSPFECRDLMRDYAGQRRGYARLVEEYLIQGSSVAVVELAEARALVRESAVSGDRLSRELPPYYIFGSFRTSQAGGTPRTALALELRHGDATLAKSTRDEVPAESVGAALQETVVELLAKGTTMPPAGSPSRVETHILIDRADVFRRLGEWDEAMPLYESALLLDPLLLQAHLRLFEGHTELMIDGGRSMRGRGGSPDIPRRVEYAEAALDHLELLLRRGEINEELGQRLRHYQAYCHLDKYDAVRDPKNIVAAFRRLCRRRNDMVIDVLADPQRRSRLPELSLSFLVSFVVYGTTAQKRVDDEGASEAICHVIETLDKGDEHAATILMLFAAYAGSDLNTAGSLPPSFLGSLRQSPSARVRFLAQALQILGDIRDQTSLDAALPRLNELAESNALGKETADYLISRAHDRLQNIRGANGAFTTASKQVIPKLTRIDGTLWPTEQAGSRSDRRTWVYDWASCGRDIDLLATSLGVFRLTGDGKAALVTRTTGKQLLWDGQYAWSTAPGAKPAILCLDPVRGEIARFDEPDVIHGTSPDYGRIVAVRPGQLCYIGCLSWKELNQRVWASLLSVSRQGPSSISRRSETIYEARTQWDRSNSKARVSPDTAIIPGWTIVVPATDDQQGPYVLVGRQGSWPLVLNLANKQPSIPSHRWPSSAVATMHDGRLLIGAGQIGSYKESSAIYYAKTLFGEPQIVVDFGERSSQEERWPMSTYYSSLLVVDHKLHLLARADSRRAPAWIAVDLKTWQPSVLVHTFPEGIAPSHDPYRLKMSDRFALAYQLRVSDRLGLILLAGGGAYRVELPPSDVWPPIDARVSSAIPPPATQAHSRETMEIGSPSVSRQETTR